MYYKKRKIDMKDHNMKKLNFSLWGSEKNIMRR